MIPAQRFLTAPRSLKSSGDQSLSGFLWRMRRGGETDRDKIVAVVAGEHVRGPKLARVEAALFVANGAMAPRKLVQVATLADGREAAALIEELNQAYDAEGGAFRVETVAGGYQLLTRPQLSAWLDRVHHRQSRMKLSPPMLETLSVIAYRQPCTRADVEAVRGVQAAEVIKQLMEKNLVRITGEDDSLGRPYLYGTTRLFLETFGLGSLDDLPMSDRLRRVVERPAEPASEAAAA